MHLLSYLITDNKDRYSVAGLSYALSAQAFYSSYLPQGSIHTVLPRSATFVFVIIRIYTASSIKVRPANRTATSPPVSLVRGVQSNDPHHCFCCQILLHEAIRMQLQFEQFVMLPGLQLPPAVLFPKARPISS